MGYKWRLVKAMFLSGDSSRLKKSVLLWQDNILDFDLLDAKGYLVAVNEL